MDLYTLDSLNFFDILFHHVSKEIVQGLKLLCYLLKPIVNSKAMGWEILHRR